jgi:hypothetical protein
MTCLAGTKTIARWFGPAVLAIVLLDSQTAQATEPTDSPRMVTAPNLPSDGRDVVAARRERDPADSGDPEGGRAVRSDGPSTQAITKLERASLRHGRIRREQERASVRPRQEALVVPWHRSGAGGIGLILGVGF